MRTDKGSRSVMWGWGGVVRKREAASGERHAKRTSASRGRGQRWLIPRVIICRCAQQLLREEFLTVLRSNTLIFIAELTLQKFYMAKHFNPNCKKMLLLDLIVYFQSHSFSERFTTFYTLFLFRTNPNIKIVAFPKNHK